MHMAHERVLPRETRLRPMPPRLRKRTQRPAGDVTEEAVEDPVVGDVTEEAVEDPEAEAAKWRFVFNDNVRAVINHRARTFTCRSFRRSTMKAYALTCRQATNHGRALLFAHQHATHSSTQSTPQNRRILSRSHPVAIPLLPIAILSQSHLILSRSHYILSRSRSHYVLSRSHLILSRSHYILSRSHSTPCL